MFSKNDPRNDPNCVTSTALQLAKPHGIGILNFFPTDHIGCKKHVSNERTQPLPEEIVACLQRALDEDVGSGDVTFTVEDIQNVRKQFPDVLILAHPECSPAVVEASDFSGSTNAIIKYVAQTSAPRYLVLTECSMGDNIAAAQPDKQMLRLCSVRCPHMNQITLEDTLEALRKEQYEIQIDEEIRQRALKSVERMLAIG